MHVVTEVLSWSLVPTAHTVQLTLPALLSVSVTLPFAHARQNEAPRTAVYRPGEHAVHVVRPDNAACRPALQLVHAVTGLPSWSASPGAHALHFLAPTRPSKSVTFPAPHALHALAPALAEKRPGAQGGQTASCAFSVRNVRVALLMFAFARSISACNAAARRYCLSPGPAAWSRLGPSDTRRVYVSNHSCADCDCGAVCS